MSTTSKRQARAWFITWNNFEEYDEELIKAEKFEYLIYQVEKGEKCGTIHLHAFIYYKTPRSWNTMKKKFDEAHLKISTYWDECARYCSKSDTRVRGPYEFGTKPEQGKRSDLRAACDIIDEGGKIEELDSVVITKFHKGLMFLKNKRMKNRTSKPEVYWLWGKTGTGKTNFVYDWHAEEDVYTKEPDDKWWDDYEQQPVCLLDDFSGNIPFRKMLRLLDRYPCRVEYKGGSVKFNSPIIYITCEFHPKDLYDEGNELNQMLRRIDMIVEFTEDIL